VAPESTAGEEVTIPLVGWQLPAPPALPASRLAPAQAPLPPPAVAPLAAIAVGPPLSTSGASGQGVMLVTFGRPHLTGTDGQPAYHGLLSMEIATYLALYPDGASTATLVDRLLPDTDPARARNQIHQGVRRLRDACRHTCGTTITIDSAKGVYRLRLHGAARCDLWDFQTALDDADHARDDDERTAALGRAVHAYTGRFADGIDAPWAEGPATTLAQQALDAARDLADLLADHDPAGAVAILEQALLHDPDPHAEAAHTHLMRLHAHTGHPADVRRVYHRLEHRLAEIGASPTPATTDLLARLLRPRTPPVR